MNIHILPTSQPSRLIIYSTLLNEFRLLDEPIDDWKHKLNIYITNDEGIKEGDWYLNGNGCYKCNNSFAGTTEMKFDNPLLQFNKKIILTTAHNLIKDGVQDISDEFLEWFVKNPSCESVEVQDWVDYYKIFIPEEDPKQKKWDKLNKKLDDALELEFGLDKSIFDKMASLGEPQEEPKQDRTCTNNCSVVCGECQIFETKQETLEEQVLSQIKFVLKFNNDAQAIRILEQYGHYKQELIDNEKDIRKAFTEGFNARYKMQNGTESLEKFIEKFKKIILI
jgi:hypothetical protein